MLAYSIIYAACFSTYETNKVNFAKQRTLSFPFNTNATETVVNSNHMSKT